jgi:hypothetical protein
MEKLTFAFNILLIAAAVVLVFTVVWTAFTRDYKLLQ